MFKNILFSLLISLISLPSNSAQYCSEAKAQLKKYYGYVIKHQKRVYTDSNYQRLMRRLKLRIENLNYELEKSSKQNELNCQRLWAKIHDKLVLFEKAPLSAWVQPKDAGSTPAAAPSPAPASEPTATPVSIPTTPPVVSPSPIAAPVSEPTATPVSTPAVSPVAPSPPAPASEPAASPIALPPATPPVMSPSPIVAPMSGPAPTPVSAPTAPPAASPSPSPAPAPPVSSLSLNAVTASRLGPDSWGA